MFGGLDLKGASDEPKKVESKQDAAAAPSASTATTGMHSAFSFLGGSVAAAAAAGTATAAPASSVFSFMNSSTADAAIPNEKDNNDKSDDAATSAETLATTNLSAFNFLSSSPAEENTSAEAAAAAATPSAFSFMTPSTMTIPEPSSAVETTPASGFSSFASKNDNTASAVVSRDSGPVEETSASVHADLFSTSTTTPSNAFGSNTSTTSTTTSSSPHQPAGSGVVFGGASTNTFSKKPIKRRARTKVGVAANTATPPPMSSSSSTMTASSHHRPTLPEPNTLEAAADAAARRAEEFIQQKIQQQQQHAATTTTTAASSEHAASAISSTTTNIIPVILQTRSVEEDEILAAAKAAAEEAQQMENYKKKSFTGGLGGLFRARSSSHTNTSHPPASASSSRDSTNGGGGGGSSTNIHGTTTSTSTTTSNSNHRPPQPTESDVSSSRGGGGGGAKESLADRLQREQEESNRAMAERQLQMMQDHHGRQKLHGDDSAHLPAPPQQFYEPIRVNPVPIRQTTTTVPPPPPAKIVAKTGKDVFNDMMSGFRAMVVLSMEEVTRLRQQRIGLLEERFVTLAKERLAIQQKEQAEAQQMAAAVAEDFELADIMGAVIENHERDRVELAAVLASIGQTVQQLDTQKNMVVQGVSKCFEDIQSKLLKFKEEQDSIEVKSATGELKDFSRVSKQLSAELERLEQDCKHIERDEKLVEEEEHELEVSISEQAGEFEKMQSEARDKLRDVEDEIEELRQQLVAKQRVAAELRTEIAGHDESILRVRVKFSRQIDRVKRKRMTLADSREDWELEKKAYQRHKDEHEAKVKAHSEALIAREQLLDSLSKEIEMAGTFESIVAKEMNFGVSLDDAADGDDHRGGALAQLQANVVKCEAAVTESKEKLKVATAALSNLEEEAKTLQARIPELEELKKVAASRRDFKAAGKASKEVKESSARLLECHAELEGEALRRKLAAEEEVKEKEIALEAKRKVALEKEKESGLAAMHRLADHIKRLVATKQSVCRVEEPNTIQGVAAFVIKEQIKALMMEGRAYGDKYGGWDELIADCQDYNSGNAQQSNDGSPQETSHSSEEQVARPEDNAAELNDNVKEAEIENEKLENDAPCTEEDKAKSMQRFRELTIQLKDYEEELEQAVASEDFEKAAELDECLKAILTEFQGLKLTDEEMEQALADSPSDSTPPADADAFPDDAVSPTEQEDGSSGEIFAQPETQDQDAGARETETEEKSAKGIESSSTITPNRVDAAEGTIDDEEVEEVDQKPQQQDVVTVNENGVSSTGDDEPVVSASNGVSAT